MIVLYISLRVPKDNWRALEDIVRDVFLPALRRQPGYRRATLCRLYPSAVAESINAAEQHFDHQLELQFDSEASRRRWVATADHATAWPAVKALTEEAAHAGYDVVLADAAAANSEPPDGPGPDASAPRDP